MLLKHQINKVLYFLVKKVVFEQLKMCHSERITEIGDGNVRNILWKF